MNRFLVAILISCAIAVPVAAGPQFARTYDDEVRGIAEAPDGGLVVLGAPAILEKLDPTGMTVEWIEQFATTVSLSAVIAARGGGYVLAGGSSGAMALVKVDGAGGVVWGRTYAALTSALALAEAANGDLVVAGIQAGSSDADVWLLRLDATGTPRWSYRYQETGEVTQVALAMLAGDETVVALTTSFKPLVFRVDAAGQVGWAHGYQHAVNGELRASAVTATADGAIIVGGASNSLLRSWVIKLTADGVVLWDRSVFPQFGSLFHARLTADASGGAGLVATSISGYPTFVHFAADGTFTPFLRYNGAGVAGDLPLQAVTAADGGFVFAFRLTTDFNPVRSWYVVKTDDQGRPYGCAVEEPAIAFSDPVVSSDVPVTPAALAVTVSPLDLQPEAATPTGTTRCAGTLGCAALPGYIGTLQAVKVLPLRQVDLSWDPDPTSLFYTAWRVADKTDIDRARACCQPPASPIPRTGPTSAHDSSIGLANPGFYQVHGYCDPFTEGP